jgi:hypothetical protein
MHPENETRLLSLTDTREQTRDILASLAKGEAATTDLTPWQALQEWLASPAAERKVAIPYAPALAERVPPIAVRLRRDFGAVLNLIRTHAILHQASRERNEEDHIVATLEDYARVRDLVDDLISEGIEAGTTGTIVTVYEGGRMLLVEIGREDGTSVGLVDLEVGDDGTLRQISSTPFSSR